MMGKVQEDTASKLDSLIFKHSHNGMFITDAESNILRVNPAFTEMTGYTLEEVYGKNPKILKSNKHDRQFYQNVWSSIEKNGYWQGIIWNRRKNGEIYPEWQTIHAVKDKNNNIINFFSIFSDVTNNNLSQDKIQRLSQYDALTELPNRLLLMDHLIFIISGAEVNKSSFAVLAININRLGIINSSLGYQAGDQAIIVMAKKLQKSVAKQIIIGRLSGDCFLAIVPTIKSNEEIIFFVQNLLKTLCAEYTIDNKKINLAVNIGVAIYPDAGKTAFDLITTATIALNKSKSIAQATFQFYTKESQTKSDEFLLLENHLYKAVDNNEFLLCYQPQIDIVSGKIVGVEALIRWQHPTLGAISPSKFIPIAEETGLIIPISEWVLKTACLQMKKWKEIGLPAIKMAVNIAATHFRKDDFLDKISRILTETKINPADLEIEITERIIMQDAEKTIDALKKLKSLGISIAIDDFGTGYSSLNYLTSLPSYR